MKQQDFFTKLAILRELTQSTLFSVYLQEQLHIKIMCACHQFSGN